MDYKEQMDIINQTINDTKYLKDNYKPSRGLIKVIRTWFLMYITSEFIFNIITEIRIEYHLHNYNWYFPLYDSFIVLASLFILIFTIVNVNKIKISYKERDILKGWLIFPILFAVNEILPVISILFNSEIASEFYSAFPLTLLLSLIMIIYIYFQYKHKELIWVIILNSLSIIITFVIMSLIINSDSIYLPYKFIIMFNKFISYKGWEIIIIFITLSILKRKLQYE